MGVSTGWRCVKLLHSPRLVVIELLVGFDTTPQIGCHQPYVIDCNKYRLRLSQSPWVVGRCNFLGISTVFQRPMTIFLHNPKEREMPAGRNGCAWRLWICQWMSRLAEIWHCVLCQRCSFYAYQIKKPIPKDTWRNNNDIMASTHVATSFWRHNGVIIASCVYWGDYMSPTIEVLSIALYSFVTKLIIIINNLLAHMTFCSPSWFYNNHNGISLRISIFISCYVTIYLFRWIEGFRCSLQDCNNIG